MKKEEQDFLNIPSQEAIVKLLEMPDTQFNKLLATIIDFRYIVSTNVAPPENMAAALVQLILR